MCRYAYKDYKSRFACFECRKSFKKTAIVDWVKHKGLGKAYSDLLGAPNAKHLKKIEKETGTTFEAIKNAYLGDVSDCPQCGKKMAAMGHDFRPPKAEKAEAWLIIESLYDHGFAFHGCGCDVGYSPPSKIRDLSSFFKDNGRLSDGEKLLKKIRAKMSGT